MVVHESGDEAPHMSDAVGVTVVEVEDVVGALGQTALLKTRAAQWMSTTRGETVPCRQLRWRSLELPDSSLTARHTAVHKMAARAGMRIGLTASSSNDLHRSNSSSSSSNMQVSMGSTGTTMGTSRGSCSHTLIRALRLRSR